MQNKQVKCTGCRDISNRWELRGTVYRIIEQDAAGPILQLLQAGLGARCVTTSTFSLSVLGKISTPDKKEWPMVSAFWG
jgi:hypothetical protein